MSTRDGQTNGHTLIDLESALKSIDKELKIYLLQTVKAVFLSEEVPIKDHRPVRTTLIEPPSTKSAKYVLDIFGTIIFDLCITA